MDGDGISARYQHIKGSGGTHILLYMDGSRNYIAAHKGDRR